MKRRKPLAAQPALQSDLGATVRLPTGQEVRPFTVVIDNIAVGARATQQRARRDDPLDRLDLTKEQRDAAEAYRRAYHHIVSGLPWVIRDRERVGGSVSSGAMLAQERAVSSAAAFRRGVQAVGKVAAEGVMRYVVIEEWSLSRYDAYRKWREGRGKAELIAALDRLAAAYGLIVRRSA